MNSTAVPPIVLLRAAPQLAALAILDAALMTAEEVLLAHYPALDQLDAVLHGERAPPEGCLVPILVARFDELRYLLDRYKVAVNTALQDPDDDFPF